MTATEESTHVPRPTTTTRPVPRPPACRRPGAPDDLPPPTPSGGARPGVLDLRGAPAPAALCWPAGDRVVVSGLPGSGKSTLMRRSTSPRDGHGLRLIDSQDVRERWARRLPAWLPYVVYRPVVRVAHYAGLWRALRSPASLLVHDCGRSAWVRRWLARDCRRRGRGLHLLLLDVPPRTALAGQVSRGRRVSRYAFAGHRRAMGRLVARVTAGRLPRGCRSVTLLDAETAQRLGALRFAGAQGCPDCRTVPGPAAGQGLPPSVGRAGAPSDRAA